MSLASVAVAGALALDLAVGEPPNALHPVAWFGRVVSWFDRSWKRPRAVGVALATVLPLAAAVAVAGPVWVAGAVDWRAGLAVGVMALFVATSFRRLLVTVGRVSALADADLLAARRELHALAGRDTSALDVGGVRSGAIESLAENLADGLVGPLAAFAVAAAVGSWAGLGGTAVLAVACGSATWVKAVNTMDSMLGYRHRPLGFGAAKADDLAMSIPARVTAVLLSVWLFAPGALCRAREWARGVPSPNSGWPMGVLAAGLDVRLEKRGAYVLNQAGSLPTHADTRRALGRVGLAALTAYGLAGVIAWY